MGFLGALMEHGFLQRAVATGLLASVACGVVGSYIVARRITYVAGGIAHCLLAGLGIARYLQVVQGWEWLHPLYGALAVALLTAVVIGWVSLHWTEREDTVISALWAVGMATGVLFIARTPGYSQDLMSYLFGNILMVSPAELWLIALLGLVVISLALVSCNSPTAVCFDPQFARLRAYGSRRSTSCSSLTALTVVVRHRRGARPRDPGAARRRCRPPIPVAVADDAGGSGAHSPVQRGRHRRERRTSPRAPRRYCSPRPVPWRPWPWATSGTATCGSGRRASPARAEPPGGRGHR